MRNLEYLAQALVELRLLVMVDARPAAVKNAARIGIAHGKNEREAELRFVAIVKLFQLGALGSARIQKTSTRLFGTRIPAQCEPRTQSRMLLQELELLRVTRVAHDIGQRILERRRIRKWPRIPGALGHPR